MKIRASATVPATLIALALVACEGEGGGSVSYVAGGGSSADCNRYTACGACTPVVGCGWCYNSDGTGTCAASPDLCPTPSFTWTWNPSGCLVLAEAGVATGDAEVTSPDGGTQGPTAEASADGQVHE
jgi:hypothetical protein